MAAADTSRLHWTLDDVVGRGRWVFTGGTEKLPHFTDTVADAVIAVLSPNE
ncbi:hypothetical protein [Nocardia brevicatena]|uniref:hypothetical protein n=1 Tax=Nocardia brevicatena TaxID=37327 RepID=UPI0002F2CFF0|nr:hypothetical protein [Nocardia brevicatena]